MHARETMLVLATLTDPGDANWVPSTSIGGLTGHMLYVDAVYGDDGTGERDNPSRPFLTIQAAIAAAQVGDLVVVRPGTYTGPVVMVDGVSVEGVSRNACVLGLTAVGAGEVMVTMAENCSFSNFTLSADASAGGSDIIGVYFGGTSNATSTLASIDFSSVGAVDAVHLDGSGVASVPHLTINDVQAQATGHGLVVNDGTNRVKNSKFNGTLGRGAYLVAGTTLFFDSTLTGVIGLDIFGGATGQVDYGTTWYGSGGSDLVRSGTFSVLGSAAPAPSVTAETTGSQSLNSGGGFGSNIIFTLGALRAQHQRVYITATVSVTSGSGGNQTTTWGVFRDGVQITGTYTALVPANLANQPRTYTWVDDTPGANPVYSLRATSTSGAISVVGHRRMVAQILQIN